MVSESYKRFTTLADLMRDLEELDDGKGEENLKKQLEVIEDIRHKVDAYKWIIDQLKMQTDYLEEKESQLYSARTRVNKSIGRIKDRLKGILTENGTDRIVGHDYELGLHKSKSFKINRPEPTTGDLLMFGKFVKTAMTWDIMEIRSQAKLGNEDTASLGEYQESTSVKFKLRTKKNED
jgi:hypothetical protein